MKKRYIIKPEHRGHRPTLDGKNPSKPLYTRMPLPLYHWATAQGPKRIRAILSAEKTRQEGIDLIA